MHVLILGGGDLASGVALRLFRSGLQVFITELHQPLVVRRLVSFAEAVYSGKTSVEEVTARRAENVPHGLSLIEQGFIPVLADPEADCLSELSPSVLIDARMIKRSPEYDKEIAQFVIGLGPGFSAGVNCHAAVETNRGHHLGRVVWRGALEADTGIPEEVMNRRAERVLRSPADGVLTTFVDIKERVGAGELIAEVAGEQVLAPFDGVLRGIMHPGIFVQQGRKIGDVDPRGDPSYCTQVSDKSLAIAGGVLEAILSRPELRSKLWNTHEISASTSDR
ncbi:MAG: selenium-dependent molybdenum cofactor biosynthesis protein YqeB [Chloroflexota bacterium]|nr:selenium-dependent molybdenum cofactor biosynthesis protein YqeB [Chloroflexota bacterium]